MSPILQEFVNTLDNEVQELVAGRKDKYVFKVLDEQGVQVPQDILDELERQRQEARSHEAIMDTMRPFFGNKLEDFEHILVHRG